MQYAVYRIHHIDGLRAIAIGSELRSNELNDPAIQAEFVRHLMADAHQIGIYAADEEGILRFLRQFGDERDSLRSGGYGLVAAKLNDDHIELLIIVIRDMNGKEHKLSLGSINDQVTKLANNISTIIGKHFVRQHDCGNPECPIMIMRMKNSNN